MESGRREQLVGHRWAIELIERSRAAGHGAHAYLLTGLPGIGKFTTAMEIAQTLLCASSSACGSCRHCRLAARSVHPDLHLIEVPSERKNIPIKDVHEFLQGIALTPVEAACKVYIIRGAEDLAEEGSNALLKTLEEPPGSVTLLLTAPVTTAVLPTIVSRCQVIALRPVAEAEIAEHLAVEHGIEVGRARAIARASEGRPGWAITAAEHPDVMDERHRRARDLLDLLNQGRLERIRYADGLAEAWGKHTDDVRDTLKAWTEAWRDVLLTQRGLADRVRLIDIWDAVQETALQLSREAVVDALAATLRTADSLDRNANPRLALESYALFLPRTGDR
ncbi:MAG: polymerase delta prime subunit [Chloroflexi bacterium]|nr:polymerase delta prime subunit [Chloroflexota bacterium]